MNATQPYRPPVSEAEIYANDGGPTILAGEALEKGYRHVLFIGKNAIEDEFTGVFQPSLDWEGTNPNDESFLTSVGNFWQNKADKKQPREFAPSWWATPFFMHPFLGEKNQHFFSPENRKHMLGSEDCTPDDLADAFHDLWSYVKWNKNMSTEAKDYYTKRRGKTEEARIPCRTTRFCSLVIGHTKKEREDAPVIIAYTSSAHEHIIAQARYRREDGDPIIDEKNKRYLLGDPSRPSGALPFRVSKVQLDDKDPQETNCLVWFDQPGVLPSNLRPRIITDKELLLRYNMSDPANWVIPTYQEQIDYMVDQYLEVEVELIREACGHRGDVPDRPANRKAAAKRKEENVEEKHAEEPSGEAKSKLTRALEAATGGASKERAEPSTPPITRTPTTEPADTETFLAGASGGKPSRLTKAEIRDLVASSPEAKVKIDTTWRLAREVVAEWFPAIEEENIPEDEVIPGDEEDEIPMDFVPNDTVPNDTVPTDTVPETAAGEDVYDMVEIRRRNFPASAYAGLSAEDKAKTDAVLLKLEKLKRAGSTVPEALSEELFNFVTLGQKSGN